MKNSQEEKCDELELDELADDEDNSKKPLLDSDERSYASSNSIQIYTERWFILFIFSMNTMANGVLFMGLSPISNITARYYHVTPVFIEWLSNSYMFVYTLVALPASYLMSKYGVKPMLITAATLDAAATAFHLAGQPRDRFSLVVIGQLFAALAFGTILQIPGQLSAVWFPENERATATSIGVFMNILGVAIGFLQPTHMVRDSKDFDTVGKGLRIFFLSQLIVCTSILVLTALFYKENPPTPPSYITSIKNDSKYVHSGQCCIAFDSNFTNLLGSLAKNQYYLAMSQSYAIYYGLYVTFSVLLNSIVTSNFPNGYETKIGWMGFTCDTVAIFSCFFIGLWLDKYHAHQVMAVLLNASSAIAWLAFVLILTRTTSFIGLFVMYSILGVVGVPYFASGIEQAAEMTYPVPGATSSAVMLIFGNLYGFIFILTLGALAQAQYIQTVGYIMFGLYVVSTVLACLAKTELKRGNAEMAAESSNSSMNDPINRMDERSDAKFDQ